MIAFHRGPAHDVTLSLTRAPFLLRVTQEGKKFDALDQVDDEPRPGEKLFVYVLVDGPIRAFVRRSKPHGSGLVLIAAYRYLEEQPKDEDMRTAERWTDWCKANAERLGFKKPAEPPPAP